MDTGIAGPDAKTSGRWRNDVVGIGGFATAFCKFDCSVPSGRFWFGTASLRTMASWDRRYLELRLTPSSTIANLMVATQEAEDWAQQTGNEEARFNRWVDAVLQLEEACIGKAETWPTVQRLYQEVQ